MPPASAWKRSARSPLWSTRTATPTDSMRCALGADLPGKDETALREGSRRSAYRQRTKKLVSRRDYIAQMPARSVGPMPNKTPSARSRCSKTSTRCSMPKAPAPPTGSKSTAADGAGDAPARHPHRC